MKGRRTIRAAELDAVRSWLRPPMRILELGGGDGYQAAQLAAAGCRVRSVDLAGRPRAPFDFYPVDDYDGGALPYDEAAFDCLYSSHVLLYIQDLDTLLAECRRVLTAHGRMVHVLPTVSWRAWTNVTHYAYVLQYALGRAQPFSSGVGVPTVGEKAASNGLLDVARKALFPRPVGPARSSLHELFTFRAARWRRRFVAGGFEVVDVRPLGLFYTGYHVLPGLGLAARRRLARLAGSASVAFHLVRR